MPKVEAPGHPGHLPPLLAMQLFMVIKLFLRMLTFYHDVNDVKIHTSEQLLRFKNKLV